MADEYGREYGPVPGESIEIRIVRLEERFRSAQRDWNEERRRFNAKLEKYDALGNRIQILEDKVSGHHEYEKQEDTYSDAFRLTIYAVVGTFVCLGVLQPIFSEILRKIAG